MNLRLPTVCLLWLYCAVDASADAPPFTLAIVPKLGPQKTSARKPIITANNFYVILTNQSEQNLRIFEDWNSWGYFNLAFIATKQDGTREYIHKNPLKDWSWNTPSTVQIPPHGHYVFSVVDLTRKTWHQDAWLGMDHIRGETAPLSLRALFTQTETNDAQRYAVWIGSATSGEKTLKIDR